VEGDRNIIEREGAGGERERDVGVKGGSEKGQVAP